MKIIGVNGYARSGKDTTADILVEHCGFKRVAFADKLREAAYALNPIVTPDPWGKKIDSDFLLDQPTCNPFRLQAVIDRYTWDGYKNTAFEQEIRGILQRLGTEVGRQILGESIWVDAVLNDLDDEGKYVFTDCRFANEAEAVTDLWGQVWRIDRPGVLPANDHISEVGLDDWNFDVRINNAGSIDDLKEKVLDHAHRI